MAKKPGVPIVAVVDTTLLRQVVGSTFHWDSRSGYVSSDLGVNTVSEHKQRPSFQAKGPLGIAGRVQRYWTTSEIRHVPALSLQTIAWEQEAELATFCLAAVPLTHLAHEGIPGATGELVWVPWQEQPASPTFSVHPVLLIHTPYESRLAEHIEIVPSLQAHDPLLHHITLVLQTAIEGADLAGQLYAESLADALAVHFLRRYGASRRSLQEVSGGLSPYKLQRTTVYIKDHLEQELSLATLATVGEASPAYFARLFKRATGLAPHQYVIARRLEQAKCLLAETDLPLSEVGLRVGCADQSHFIALFRAHVSLTPKAYRDKTRREYVRGSDSVRFQQALVSR
jgi:AraC-like DNA-binding protein